jgi:hypothetical protein
MMRLSAAEVVSNGEDTDYLYDKFVILSSEGEIMLVLAPAWKTGILHRDIVSAVVKKNKLENFSVRGGGLLIQAITGDGSKVMTGYVAFCGKSNEFGRVPEEIKGYLAKEKDFILQYLKNELMREYKKILFRW